MFPYKETNVWEHWFYISSDKLTTIFFLKRSAVHAMKSCHEVLSLLSTEWIFHIGQIHLLACCGESWISHQTVI